MDEAKQRELLSSKAVIMHGADSTLYALSEMVNAGFGEIIVLNTNSSISKQFDCQIQGLQKLNNDVRLKVREFNNLDDCESLIEESDILLESILDWQLKLGLSDLAMRFNKPLIHSGCVGHRYQMYSMIPGKSACLRCVFPAVGIEDFPLGLVKAHSLTPVEAWAGALMAIDAIKIACDLGVIQSRSLWRFDALSGDIEAVRNLTRSHDCPDCGPSLRSRS